jgi:hypothetical protein
MEQEEREIQHKKIDQLDKIISKLDLIIIIVLFQLSVLLLILSKVYK